jgi:4-hydroxy-3-methylbut-2-enyl diphosphate reductase
MDQAIKLGKFITGELPSEQFYTDFKHQVSAGFNLEKDLQRIGVVNQTTMLASDTQSIADYLKGIMMSHYGLDENNIRDRFADTRDTLCYATNDNQTSVTGMLQTEADLAVVVGGYNSSNTSHLVELCEEKLPTYYINNEEKILSRDAIKHFNFHTAMELVTENYLPVKEPVNILVTSGASCPDALVEGVIKKLAGFYPASRSIEDLVDILNNQE